MVYGIAINEFDTEIGMLELKNDIELFNPKLQLATTFRQITSKESRANKQYGSVIILFDNEEMYQWSLKSKLFTGGILCHTRKSGKLN